MQKNADGIVPSPVPGWSPGVPQIIKNFKGQQYDRDMKLDDPVDREMGRPKPNYNPYAEFECKKHFDGGIPWGLGRDPVVLDRDGDGLETVCLAANVYFDHDGDGVFTETGWAGPKDALVVWDRNANGSIDTGAELFGDFTPLPNVSGAGNVRELQQAAAQSESLAELVAQFQNATTRAEQKTLLDQLLTAWADTSGMARRPEERLADPSSSSVSGAEVLSDPAAPYLSQSYRNLIAEWSQKPDVLEAFNGQYLFNLPEQKSQTDGANRGLAILPCLRINFANDDIRRVVA